MVDFISKKAALTKFMALMGAIWGVMLFATSVKAETRIIAVQSSATRNLNPNLISFSLEVWARSAAAQRTQTLASDELKRVHKVLENYKIPKENIQTESFSFGPEYVWDQSVNQNKMVGFSSVQVLRIEMKSTEQAGKLIDAMTVAEKSAEGRRREYGTNVSRIAWDSTERKTKEAEALSDAVKTSRSQAEIMAKAAGVKIKKVQKISNIIRGGEPGPVHAKMSMMSEAGGSTTLSAGIIEVEMSVSVEYEIQ